jgi:hypothetical protein
MALKAANQCKLITASGGGTLTPGADESFLVRNIHCVPSTNDTYLTVQVNSTTVGKFRVKGKSGNHLPFPVVATGSLIEHKVGTVFDWARAHAMPLDIPVASEQTLTVSRYAETGRVLIIYDIYDAGEVKQTDPNGSQAVVKRYLHYGTNTSAITASPAAIDSSLIWSGGDGFPFNGSSVPLAGRFTILGILGCPCHRGDGSGNKGATTHIMLIRRNEVLFDEDRQGLPFLGDATYTTNATGYSPVASVVGPATATVPQPALWLDLPIVLPAGEQLTTMVVVTGAAASGIAAAEIDVCYLMQREYGVAA